MADWGKIGLLATLGGFAMTMLSSAAEEHKLDETLDSKIADKTPKYVSEELDRRGYGSRNE